MPKFDITAAGQTSPEFQCRGDMGSKPGARFKIIHPALGSNVLQVEQKCSDGNWWLVHQIEDGSLATVLDQPVDALMRIKCSTYGGSPFSIIYQE